MQSHLIKLVALHNNVVFMPRKTFFATKPKNNFIRLAFVTVTEDRIEKGIQLLAELINRKINRHTN